MKDKNFSEQEIKRKVFSFIEERKLIPVGQILSVFFGCSLRTGAGALFLLPWRISIMVSGKRQRRMRIL